jgi:hypothetical protein
LPEVLESFAELATASAPNNQWPGVFPRGYSLSLKRIVYVFRLLPFKTGIVRRVVENQKRGVVSSICLSDLGDLRTPQIMPVVFTKVRMHWITLPATFGLANPLLSAGRREDLFDGTVLVMHR